MGFSRLLIVLIGVVAAGATQTQRSESPALTAFPFDQPGNYEFHFQQAHRREMTLLLEVSPTPGEPERALLTHLKTVIEVALVDRAGRTICRAVGSSSEGVTHDGWVLRRGAGEAAFWHFNCSEVELERSQLYTLKVRIRDVDPKTPKIQLTPMFERSDDFSL